MQKSCKKKISLLILGVFILSCTPLFAQNYFVYGNIKDKTTNIPISKLEIYEEGTSKLLCTSNQSGNFQFSTKKKNISIEWFNYDNIQSYPQLNPPFDPYVSVLDLIFNMGPHSKEYLRNSI